MFCLGELRMENIPAPELPATSQKIKVTCAVDSTGLLTVEANMAITGKTEKLTIDPKKTFQLGNLF